MVIFMHDNIAYNIIKTVTFINVLKYCSPFNIRFLFPSKFKLILFDDKYSNVGKIINNSNMLKVMNWAMPNMALAFKQMPKVIPQRQLLKKVIKYENIKPNGIKPKNHMINKYQ